MKFKTLLPGISVILALLTGTQSPPAIKRTLEDGTENYYLTVFHFMVPASESQPPQTISLYGKLKETAVIGQQGMPCLKYKFSPRHISYYEVQKNDDNIVMKHRYNSILIKDKCKKSKEEITLDFDHRILSFKPGRLPIGLYLNSILESSAETKWRSKSIDSSFLYKAPAEIYEGTLNIGSVVVDNAIYAGRKGAAYGMYGLGCVAAVPCVALALPFSLPGYLMTPTDGLGKEFRSALIKLPIAVALCVGTGIPFAIGDVLYPGDDLSPPASGNRETEEPVAWYQTVSNPRFPKLFDEERSCLDTSLNLFCTSADSGDIRFHTWNACKENWSSLTGNMMPRLSRRGGMYVLRACQGSIQLTTFNASLPDLIKDFNIEENFREHINHYEPTFLKKSYVYSSSHANDVVHNTLHIERFPTKKDLKAKLKTLFQDNVEASSEVLALSLKFPQEESECLREKELKTPGVVCEQRSKPIGDSSLLKVSIKDIAKGAREVNFLTRKLGLAQDTMIESDAICIHEEFRSLFGIKILKNFKEEFHAYLFPEQSKIPWVAVPFLSREIKEFYDVMVAKLPQITSNYCKGSRGQASISENSRDIPSGLIWGMVYGSLLQTSHYEGVLTFVKNYAQSNRREDEIFNNGVEIIADCRLAKNAPIDLWEKLIDFPVLSGRSAIDALEQIYCDLLRNQNISFSFIKDTIQSFVKTTHSTEVLYASALAREIGEWFEALMDCAQKFFRGQEVFGITGSPENAAKIWIELASNKHLSQKKLRKVYEAASTYCSSKNGKNYLMDFCFSFAYNPNTPVELLDQIYSLAQGLVSNKDKILRVLYYVHKHHLPDTLLDTMKKDNRHLFTSVPSIEMDDEEFELNEMEYSPEDEYLQGICLDYRGF